MDTVSAREEGYVTADTLYYVAFTLYVGMTMLLNTAMTQFFGMDITDLSHIVYVLVAVLLVTKLMLRPPSAVVLVISAVLVAVGCATWAMSDLDWLFWLALFIVSAKGIDKRRLLIIALAVTSILFVLVLIDSQLGLVENRAYPRSSMPRYAAGFAHPNTLGFYAFSVCFLAATFALGNGQLQLRRELSIALVLVLFVALQVLNLMIADSRSSLVMSIIAALLFVVLSFVRGRQARRRIFISLFVVILASIAASYFLMATYDPTNETYVALDKLLSERISLAHHYLNERPLTLFGSSFADSEPIDTDMGTHAPVTFLVDNSYCRLLIRFGIIPTIMFLAGIALLAFQWIRNDRWDSIAYGLVIALLYGLTEPIGIRVDWNIFLIAIGTDVLYGDWPPIKDVFGWRPPDRSKWTGDDRPRRTGRHLSSAVPPDDLDTHQYSAKMSSHRRESSTTAMRAANSASVRRSDTMLRPVSVPVLSEKHRRTGASTSRGTTGMK